MDVARSKGQMLRRRQLADELVALQTRCAPGAAGQRGAANIEQLKQEIQDLRERLVQAEEQLRKLESAGP